MNKEIVRRYAIDIYESLYIECITVRKEDHFEREQKPAVQSAQRCCSAAEDVQGGASPSDAAVSFRRSEKAGTAVSAQSSKQQERSTAFQPEGSVFSC